MDILFPPLCHACKSFIPQSGALLLCDKCREKILPVRSPLCQVCGLPFPVENGIDHTCGACITTRRHFTAARAAVHFDGPVRELIHRLKYGKKVHLSRPLGMLAAHHLADFALDSGGELLVPVPLHPRRLRQRSFNQALLIAEFLANSWRLPLSRNNLRRIRWTEPQIDLSVDERAKNVRGAFAVKDPALFSGKRLILVDDVYTTGSTVSECAKELRRAGAREVFVCTVARALPG